ncbi:MAG: hypothetical protein ACRKGH_02025 [Dehalogenimonas sp.]
MKEPVDDTVIGITDAPIRITKNTRAEWSRVINRLTEEYRRGGFDDDQ